MWSHRSPLPAATWEPEEPHQVGMEEQIGGSNSSIKALDVYDILRCIGIYRTLFICAPNHFRENSCMPTILGYLTDVVIYYAS